LKLIAHLFIHKILTFDDTWVYYGAGPEVNALPSYFCGNSASVGAWVFCLGSHLWHNDAYLYASR